MVYYYLRPETVFQFCLINRMWLWFLIDHISQIIVLMSQCSRIMFLNYVFNISYLLNKLLSQPNTKLSEMQSTLQQTANIKLRYTPSTSCYVLIVVVNFYIKPSFPFTYRFFALSSDKFTSILSTKTLLTG